MVGLNNKGLFFQVAFFLLVVALAFPALAPAQSRRSIGQLGEKLINIEVNELTLESINFRDQTARLSLGLRVSNSLVPIKLKDFNYDLRLFDQPVIQGRQPGELKIGGKEASVVKLPITVHLRSVPGVVWSAFSNRGRVKYELETGFTLPLFIFEQRVDKSFAGEVPLKSLVDAASILRASRLNSAPLYQYQW